MKEKLKILLKRLKPALPAKALPQPPGKTPEQAERPASAVMLRPTKYTSRYYFALSKRIWRILILSVPADLLLLCLPLQRLEGSGLEDPLYAALVVLVAVTVASLARDKIVTAILELDTARGRVALFSRKYSWLVIGAMVLLIAAELFSRLGRVNIWSVLIIVVAAAGAFRSLRKTMAERHAHHERITGDRTYWVEETNQKVFFAALIPVIAARLASLTGGVASLISSGSVLLFLLYPLSSIFLLLLAMPVDRHFIMTCKSCGMQTSLILKKTGLCPQCEISRAVQSNKKRV